MIEGGHRGIAHAGIIAHDGFDLGELDAEAADLHLPVASADELDVPVAHVAHDIARAVQRCVVALVEGVDPERFGRLLGPVQVAVADLGPGQPQLACRADGNPLAARIDDVAFHVVEHAPDGDVVLAGYERVNRRVDGAFARAVRVVGQGTFGHVEGHERLAAHAEMLHRDAFPIDRELAPDLGGHKRMRHARALEVGSHRHEVEAYLLGHDRNCRAAGERRVHVHHASVEPIARISPHAMCRTERVVALIPVDEAHEVAMREPHALGHARRARRVQQYEQVARLHVNPHVSDISAEGGQVAHVRHDENLAVVIGDKPPQLFGRNQQLRPGVADHEIQALGRICRVERLVGAAGAQNAERCNRHPEAARHEHRHDIAAAESQVRRVSGKPAGQIVELAVRQLIVFEDGGHVAGIRRRSRAEQRDDGLRLVVGNFGFVEGVEFRCLDFVDEVDVGKALACDEPLDDASVAARHVGDVFVGIAVALVLHTQEQPVGSREHLGVERASRGVALEHDARERASANGAERQVISLVGEQHVARHVHEGRHFGEREQIVGHRGQNLRLHRMQVVGDARVRVPRAMHR